MFVRRTAFRLACAAACAMPAAATAGESPPMSPTAVPGTRITLLPSRGYLGLNLGRSRQELSCGLPGFACDPQIAAAQLYGGYMLNKNVALELGYLDLGRVEASSRAARAQGVNLSLVGRTQLADTVDVYGHMGTTYGRIDTSVLGAGATAGPDNGFGLSYGAGVSWHFSPRGSATLGWNSHALRLPGSGRDTVRATSLGLQWRY